MLWIQGGAFISKLNQPSQLEKILSDRTSIANFNANYNGTGLVEASDKNVIIVTFNFRVGPYGFLASEDVRRDGDLNAGLLDQRQAMSWIQKHIGKFGGDPDKVTIFGTSSGAGSVLLQTLAYRGAPTPLFAAAIASAPYESRVLTVEESEFQYQQLLDATSCKSLRCLRLLSTQQLQSANTARPYPGQDITPLFPYSPCIDGNLIAARPSELLAAGLHVKKPLLLGSSTNEGTIFAPEANDTSEVAVFFRQQFPDLTTKDTARINAEYSSTPQSPKHAPYFAGAAAAYGDSTFFCPGLAFASAFSNADVPVYVFRNNILDPVNIALGLGVPHTWEVQAVWGPQYAVNHAAAPGANSYENVNAGIVPIVQRYWTSFARAWDPNIYKLEGSPDWRLFKLKQRLRLQTNATGMENVDDIERDRCEFWQGLQSRTHH